MESGLRLLWCKGELNRDHVNRRVLNNMYVEPALLHEMATTVLSVAAHIRQA
jgi:hypothetical protein